MPRKPMPAEEHPAGFSTPQKVGQPPVDVKNQRQLILSFIGAVAAAYQLGSESKKKGRSRSKLD